MRRGILVLIVISFCCRPVSSQHSVAVSGYYPINYMGDIWTGVVTQVDENFREITLIPPKGYKPEVFVGVIEDGYSVLPKDQPERPLKMSDIRVGRTITVYYLSASKKVDGKKVTVNMIFNIASIPNNTKYRRYFMAFNR